MSHVWLSWENQIRNRSMSAQLGAELVVFNCKGRRVTRYAKCIVNTIMAIYRRRPEVVFAQNPSIVLNYLLLLLRSIFGFRFVSDAHYAGVIASNGATLLQRALNFCNRQADLVIVTNENHRAFIHSIGGVATICEDPLPDLSQYPDRLEVPKKVLFVCSFDVDEPYLEVFRAAEALREYGFETYVSGNFRKVGLDPAEFPRVRFLGFVPEAEFYSHFREAQVVVDLTTQDDCLLCGAYEAMSLEKPLVTSDKRALRTFFTSGAVFVAPDAKSIAAGIRSAYAHRAKLKAQITVWKREAFVLCDARIQSIRFLLGACGQL